MGKPRRESVPKKARGHRRQTKPDREPPTIHPVPGLEDLQQTDPETLTWGLTNPREIAFVRHYLDHGNKSRAAIAAGYAPSNARAYALELLAKPRIKAAVRMQLEEDERRYGITRDRVIREYASVAFSRITDAVDLDEEGDLSLRNLEELPDRVQVAIRKIDSTSSPGEFGTSYKRGIEMHDKLGALDRLAKMFGWDPGRGSKVTLPDGTTVEGGEFAPITIYQLPDNRRLTVPVDGRSLTSALPVNGGPPHPEAEAS